MVGSGAGMGSHCGLKENMIASVTLKYKEEG
jgi:hypothetical protein